MSLAVLDYKSFFNVRRNEQTAEVFVIQQLTDDILESSTSITLIVVASVEGSDITGNAALVIHLPIKEDPGEKVWNFTACVTLLRVYPFHP